MRSPIPPGLGSDEQEVAGATVADFERESASQRPGVHDPRLGLYVHTSAVARHFAIPRPKVSGGGQWHLGPPPQLRCEAPTEPGEQRFVATVSDRVAARIGSNRELETHDRACRREQV